MNAICINSVITFLYLLRPRGIDYSSGRSTVFCTFCSPSSHKCPSLFEYKQKKTKTSFLYVELERDKIEEKKKRIRQLFSQHFEQLVVMFSFQLIATNLITWITLLLLLLSSSLNHIPCYIVY